MKHAWEKLMLMLAALCLLLCGCSKEDVSLPAQVDMIPGSTAELIGLAEYTGPDLSADDVLKVLMLMQDSGGEGLFAFQSSQPGVAEVSGDGVITARAVGQTTITVSCPSLGYEEELTVRVWDYATGLTAEPALLLQAGDTAPLNARLTGANSEMTVRYLSEDPAVAQVDDDGAVTAVADGETVVRAYLPGSSLSADCVVTVGQTVQSVSLSSAEAVLLPGDRMRLEAAVWPAAGQEVRFASSDEAVATVDDSGMVRAAAPGTVQISATAGGKTAVCLVTVEGAEEPAVAEGAEEEIATPESAATPETATPESAATPETATPESAATPETATPESATPETAEQEDTPEKEEFATFWQRLLALFGAG